MGTRFELTRPCIYCKAVNKDIWYAPTCSSFTFKCEKCGKTNFITVDLDVKKIEDVVFSDVLWAIDDCANLMDERQIEACAKSEFNRIKEERERIWMKK